MDVVTTKIVQRRKRIGRIKKPIRFFYFIGLECQKTFNSNTFYKWRSVVLSPRFVTITKNLACEILALTRGHTVTAAIHALCASSRSVLLSILTSQSFLAIPAFVYLCVLG